MKKQSSQPVNVYQIVTDRILKTIEETGKLTWVKPWKFNGVYGNYPMNGKTKHRYEGVNFFLLGSMPFESPYWLTYNQITEMKGTVKKGEHATQVVFWKINSYEDVDKTTGDIKTKKVPLLRYYNVFNEQCEGIEIKSNVEPVPYSEKDALDRGEEVIKFYSDNNRELKQTVHESGGAFYTPSLDSINMPLLAQFENSEAFYSTYFHEMAHSTGAEKRLNRKEVTSHIGSFTSKHDYGYEELTAELTAAFICAEIGISNETTENHSSAYLKSWMNTIKADNKLFIMAAARATKAAKFILKNEKGYGEHEEVKEELQEA